MYSTDIVGKNPEVCSREQRSRPDRAALPYYRLSIFSSIGLENSARCPSNDTKESINVITKNIGKIFFFLSFFFLFSFFFSFFSFLFLLFHDPHKVKICRHRALPESAILLLYCISILLIPVQ